MYKRILLTTLISALCGMLWACDSESGSDSEQGCQTDDDCIWPDYPVEMACFRVNGKNECIDTCLGNAEGDSAPTCLRTFGFAPDPYPMYMISDYCQKDDNGRLYSVPGKRKSEYCEEGCYNAHCITCGDGCPDVDGKPMTCVVIDGQETCKEPCLRYFNDDTKPFCYYYPLNTPLSDDYSVVTACAKDDIEKSYAVSSEWTKCKGKCDEETGLCDADDCESLHCEGYAGGREMVCVSFSGINSCKPKCHEGNYCHQDSYPDAPMQASLDACAKDDNGTSYAASTQTIDCEYGCENGACLESPPEICDLECPDVDGVKQVCAFVNGKAKCEYACLGTKDGVNAPVCYTDNSSKPHKTLSITDVCKTDTLGTLYSIRETSSKYKVEECPNGCQDGVCVSEPPQEECTKDCMMVGGDPKVCVKISGKESCKTACFGKAAGENAPVCYQNASLGPNGPVYSVVDTCAKDDLGTLYSQNAVRTECPGKCNNEDGLCIAAVTECKKDCALDGGDPRVCVIISGKETCATACFGKTDGENAPVCYQNGSTGPDSPFYSVVDTCAKDDIGTLYSVNDERTKCDFGCDDTTGQCKEGKVSEECEKGCSSYAGSRPKICVLVSGTEDCKDKCLGDKVGENAPVCYKTGVDASMNPIYSSIVDKCVKDDLGTLYSTKPQLTECPKNCNSSTGLCE